MNPESSVFQGFTLVPELVHLLQGRLAGAAALLPQAPLDVAETAFEFGVRAAQRRLRIDPEVAADVDDAEQHVAELVGDLRLPRLIADFLAQLAELLVELVERAADVGPFESDQRRALAELVRASQRRQCQRYIVEHARARALALQPLLLFPRD